MPKVIDVFPVDATDGTFGIEIEVEGNNLPDSAPGFQKEHDGSLRGESAEFVFRGPVDKKATIKRIRGLYSKYKQVGTTLNNSYRCSVHVHINVQQFTMTQVANMFTIYALFEEYLVKYCGEHREGNLFCLRVSDAEYTCQAFLRALETQSYGDLRSDRLRYSAINLAALGKYGSLEFRAMRGSNDVQDIINWVELLDCVRTAALQYDSPRDIIEGMSGIGCAQLAEDIFGDLLGVLPLEGDWEHVIMQNMRMIQQIAYIPDYTEIDKPVTRRASAKGETEGQRALREARARVRRFDAQGM